MSPPSEILLYREALERVANAAFSFRSSVWRQPGGALPRSSAMDIPVKHPRRVGFLVFNLAAAVAFAALALWLTTLSASGDVGAVPNTALAATGLVVIGAIWVGTWIAWGVMVWSRRRR